MYPFCAHMFIISDGRELPPDICFARMHRDSDRNCFGIVSANPAPSLTGAKLKFLIVLVSVYVFDTAIYDFVIRLRFQIPEWV